MLVQLQYYYAFQDAYLIRIFELLLLVKQIFGYLGSVLADQMIGYLGQLKGLHDDCIPLPPVATFQAMLRYFTCHPTLLLKHLSAQSIFGPELKPSLTVSKAFE